MIIVLLLMSIMKSVVYAIRIICIKDTQYKVKTVISILTRFATFILEVSFSPIATMINVINGRIFTLAGFYKTLNMI